MASFPSHLHANPSIRVNDFNQIHCVIVKVDCKRLEFRYTLPFQMYSHHTRIIVGVLKGSSSIYKVSVMSLIVNAFMKKLMGPWREINNDYSGASGNMKAFGYIGVRRGKNLFMPQY